MKSLVVHSPDAMRRLGAAIARGAPEGTTLALIGDLGAGKTCFAGGVGEGLGVRGPITSPTFQLMAIYEGEGGQLVHVDLYRLGDPSELIELGLDELLGRQGVSVVEWADRFPEALPEDRLEIRIGLLPGEDRAVALRALGPRGDACLNRLGDIDGMD